jgi:hypothetical protein
VIRALIAVDLVVVLAVTILGFGLRSLSVTQHEMRRPETDDRDRLTPRPPLA